MNSHPVCPLDWKNLSDPVPAEMSEQAIEALEQGSVIFFPQLAFALEPSEREFLHPEVVKPSRKNVSYCYKKDAMKGEVTAMEEHRRMALKNLMRRYAEYAQAVIQHVFPDYVPYVELGRTSYRPVEAKHRETLSPRKDDRRLHVDAFPATPNQGKRLLRVFTNINPNGEPRVWKVGEPFPAVVGRFLISLKSSSLVKRKFLQWTGITKGFRTTYDDLMLQLHDGMKLDLDYQKNGPFQSIEFPPGSTWVVFTDQVSHAALSGQFCLEQTFYLPVEGMRNPEQSPFKVLSEHFA